MKKLILMFLFLQLCGCKNFFASKGDSGQSSDQSGENPLGVTIFDSKDKLPECKSSLEKILIYVKDEKKFYTCKNKKWSEVPIEGEQGETGEQGKRGPSGVVSSDITSNWQSVWKNSVKSIAYIESKYEGGGCTRYESGTGFVVGVDLVATNGHVVKASQEDDLCGTMDLTNSRMWFATDEKGDAKHNVRGSDATVVKVDRSIATTDDTVLLQAATAGRTPLTLSLLDEASNHITGDGVKLGDDVLLIGFTGGSTFAHFATGRTNAIQATGPRYLNSLISRGLIASGKIVYQYDLVSGAGASGSPLFSLNGEVIGINFAGDTAQSDTDYGYGVQIKPLRHLLSAPRNWQNP